MLQVGMRPVPGLATIAVRPVCGIPVGRRELAHFTLPLYTRVHEVLSQRLDPECWLLQLQQHQQKGNPAEKCKMQFITYLLKDVNCRFIYLSL